MDFDAEAVDVRGFVFGLDLDADVDASALTDARGRGGLKGSLLRF